ncbi:MAG: suppressor of fused domain protein [Hyphomicrobiaceae bacterium]
MRTQATLVEHLEGFVGPIQRGWNGQQVGERWPFQIVQLSGRTEGSATTLATLGLSSVPLRNSGQSVRQELLLFLGASNFKNAPGIVQQVASEVVDSGTALSVGQVLGPRGILFEGSTVSAFLALDADSLIPGVGLFRNKKLGEVKFIGLLPITSEEANYVKRAGPAAFMKEILIRKPDLFEFRRKSWVK